MIKRHDHAAREGEGRSPTWRERLSDWMRGVRPDRPREVERPWVETVLEARSLPLSREDLASAKKTYLLRLRERFGALHLYGLDERRRTAQESGQRLDALALYRPLNTTFRVPPEEKADEGEGGPPSPGTPKTRPQTLLEAVGQRRHVVVRGTHGAGKSTFVRFLALSLAEQSADGAHPGLARLQPAWTHGWMYPLWIDLRCFRESVYNDGTAVGLCDYIAAELGIHADQLCTQVIGPGGVVLLLDGLAAAPDATAAFVGGLDTIASLAPQEQPNGVFVTSQPYVAYDQLAGDPFAGFSEIALAPWDLDQMGGFVRGWYAELRRKDWVDEQEARDLPGQLCSALRRDEVRALAQRPSLMAAIALLHTLRGRLPVDRGMFYHRLIDLILAAWSEGRTEGERDLRQVFDLDGLRSAVSQLTYHGYTHLEDAADLVEFSESDLRATLVNVCRDGRWESANELVARALARLYILDERSQGVYTLVDLDLQAYIAAHHLSDQPDLPRLVVHLAEEDLNRWRPVIVYVVSRLAWLNEDLPAALDLVDALLQPSMPGRPGHASAAVVWRMAWLAGEALAYLAQSFDLKAASPLVDRARERLATMLEQGLLDPVERAAAGRALDRLPSGDLRLGVSASESLWCEVPACPFWFGEGGEARVVELDTFWVSRYPVTNAQYAAFVEATGHTPPSHWQGNRPPPGLGNHPVVNVTWHDVTAYCEWWTGHVHDQRLYVWHPGAPSVATAARGSWQMRLPTSGEWEKAARGGLLIPTSNGSDLVDNPLPRRRFPWGETWSLSTGGVKGDEMRCNVSESSIGATTPVGMYADGASPYGVMDAAGNVWEWCLDWADEQAHYKIRRGGAFRYAHDHSRCSAFDKAHPDLAWPYVGFRPILGPPAPDPARQ